MSNAFELINCKHCGSEGESTVWQYVASQRQGDILDLQDNQVMEAMFRPEQQAIHMHCQSVEATVCAVHGLCAN
eukprot:4782559-Amphidinium_carterae.1